MVRFCSVKGCGGKHHAKGLCRPHYQQLPEVKKRNRDQQRVKLSVNDCVNCGVKCMGERCRKCMRGWNVRKKAPSKLSRALSPYNQRVQEALVLDGVLLVKELRKRGVVV